MRDLCGVGGHEHDFHAVIARQRLRELGAGGTVAQIDVDQGKAAIGRGLQCIGGIRRDRLHRIAGIGQDPFQVERDEDFVFDDKGGGGHGDYMIQINVEGANPGSAPLVP